MAQLSTPLSAPLAPQKTTVESIPNSLPAAPSQEGSLSETPLSIDPVADTNQPEEGMSREELIALVKTIMDYGRMDDGQWIEQARQWIDSFETDYPQAGLLKILRQHIADPEVEGYIFWPRLHTDPPKEMTPTEIIDKALSYQPRQ
ncbi:MAG: hypothetical protein AAGD25_38565 [Cyanobacteria bacterium P01_F01_bin.150]